MATYVRTYVCNTQFRDKRNTMKLSKDFSFTILVNFNSLSVFSSLSQPVFFSGVFRAFLAIENIFLFFHKRSDLFTESPLRRFIAFAKTNRRMHPNVRKNIIHIHNPVIVNYN